MRWKGEDSGTKMISRLFLFFLILAIGDCDGARRQAQRRKDTARSPELYLPAPSAESLQAIAQAMNAAGFEAITEGKALVKRLIPADSQPDLDVVEYQGVIGKAGVDFPAYPNIPSTGFNCKNVPTGYYADLETDCQVFHICDTSRKISFLCPNGTIFSQSHLICDWWFKVDCASAPALYESSAEYYSNEQKKSQKITQSLSKNADLQQIGSDTNLRTETRRTSANIPTATERLLRHRQRLQSSGDAQLPISKATSRSYQALFDFNPTQRTQATTAFEKRRKNLVQLITNGFGNGPDRSTQPTYTEAPSYRSTQATLDHNNLREMQVAAETASFTNNNNRQFLQEYNSKNFRPYPVYTPNLTTRQPKAKSNPNLTSLYDIRDQTLGQTQAETTTTKRQVWFHDSTTKRPTLMPYTKAYTTNTYDKKDPYTRPGVSLLKDFLNKKKNETLTTTTEKVKQATERSFYKTNIDNKVSIETKNSFESATKIPETTRNEFTQSSEPSIATSRSDTYTYLPQITTEPYQERRDRLIRKLNFESVYGTTPTPPTLNTEKFYGDQPNRPGLVVPPSLTPKTLHSLAIYYATALDNLSTTPPPEEETQTTSPPFDEYGDHTLEDSLPALFSRHTINKYSNLFSNGKQNADLLEEIKSDPNGTYNELVDDLTVQQSQNPLATSPQIRELAQVFTHALSAYLQDPVQFRKALSEIRPTQPTFGDVTTEESVNTEPTTTVNEDDDEILGFSDDNKISRPSLVSLRDAKALKLSTPYPLSSETVATQTEQRLSSTETVPNTYPTTPRSPFRCCGRISASYTTPTATAPVSYTNIVNAKSFGLRSNDNQDSITSTESTYTAPSYIGNRNNINDSPYGQGVNPIESKPLNEYIEATNLPTAWGIDTSETTISPITNAHANTFESKKIKAVTYIPTTTAVYFTENDSVELENEEELQRAHSQSFLSPQDNAIGNRQGKKLNLEGEAFKKPSEELEAPTLPDSEATTFRTTTQSPSTTTTKTEEQEIATTVSPTVDNTYTSPDSEKTTNYLTWSSTYGTWHSTVVDPITVNDGLSQTTAEESAQGTRQTASWDISTVTTTASPIYTGSYEQTVSPSSNVELSTPSSITDDRFGRFLREQTSTEPGQDISTIADTVVEKAKEIMNSTTTEKLMNVMKKTKSKTVKRLILLLVQTCDDDHNTTAEASKRALLEALMAVSQKDMDEIAKEELEEIPLTTVDYESVTTEEKRSDRRRAKSLNFDASAINSLSNPSTTEYIRTTVTTTTEAPTETVPVTITTTTRSPFRRGAKKFQVKTTQPDIRVTRAPFVDIPKAEARVAPNGPELKGASDTRALELLRSLYTIAARWG
ncbi:mucin-2 [Plodia interpunctella]|uniref:mucin-2 n=1 Tax=Plodia interpunctella TaxID=58824 RepID=UPI002368E560|nr:mucin-4 [Plodia interpunctella]XP_053615217.1 mucin-4 [Plodia interpunctella]XP_053615218.1 mucin-4 [Plodia interpunctella]